MRIALRACRRFDVRARCTFCSSNCLGTKQAPYLRNRGDERRNSRPDEAWRERLPGGSGAVNGAGDRGKGDTRLTFAGTRSLGLQVSEVSQASADEPGNGNGAVPERTAETGLSIERNTVPRNQESGRGPELFKVDSRAP